MKRVVLPVALIALFAVACDQATTDPAVEAPEEVAFKKAAASGESATDELGGRHIVVFSSMNKIPKDFEKAVTDLGGTVDAAYEQVGAALVSGLDQAAAAELLRRNDVQYAELEPVLEMRLPDLAGNRVTSQALPASPSDPAGAFFFPDQWNMRAIDAPEAWAAGRLGTPGVTVAILDTGIDYLHGDLEGHVDLSRSVSFLPQDDVLVDLIFGLHHIADLVWHGTHVASKVVSSGWGMAGVTSQVTLIGVKVCSVYGGCPGGAIFAGIAHAVENGADVINMSLGGAFLKSDNPGFVSVINRLFNYARSMRVTVVVAAGNDAWDLDHNGNWYSTYCDAPHVICVSATGPTDWDGATPGQNVDAPADYTNYGRSSISVAAPGGNVGDYVAVVQPDEPCTAAHFSAATSVLSTTFGRRVRACRRHMSPASPPCWSRTRTESSPHQGGDPAVG